MQHSNINDVVIYVFVLYSSKVDFEDKKRKNSGLFNFLCEKNAVLNCRQIKVHIIKLKESREL